MIAVPPSLIPLIDAYAKDHLGLPEALLMQRAGEAVASVIAERIKPPATLLFYCGGGNNGGDGYAAAVILHRRGYRALAVDLFGLSQRSEAGKSMLSLYKETVGEPLTAKEAEAISADCLIDAVFGTGGRSPLPPAAEQMAARFQASHALRVAIDIPLGINGESGEVAETVAPADTTVCLSLPKYGLYSYPAKAYVGQIFNFDLGLPKDRLTEAFSLTDSLTDEALLSAAFPKRDPNTHKGKCGHLLLLSGSPAYRGAALMAGLSAAALRCGCGLLTLASCQSVCDAAVTAIPEVMTKVLRPFEEEKSDTLLALAEGKGAILLGPGCGSSRPLAHHIYALLENEGAPLLLDADALNSLSLDINESKKRLISAKRKVIFTPHPLEFARLIGSDVKEVQAHRLPLGRRFAEEIPGVLVLKGAGTVIAEGEHFLINTSGSPALAKGGSGDILAGAIAAIAAGGTAPFLSAAAAVFLHGAAGESLAEVYSEYGVLPTDLPKEMARILSKLQGGDK